MGDSTAAVVGADPDPDRTLADVDLSQAGSAFSPQSEVRHIGKYVVRRFLGHGAMGRVYLGQHPELQLQVAIKVIDERYAADPRYRRQFLQEARLASQINHPNVIRVSSQSLCNCAGQYVSVLIRYSSKTDSKLPGPVPKIG